MGIKTLVVSLGDYRRRVVGGAQTVPKDYFNQGDRSPETQKLRQEVAAGCEKIIWDFFDGPSGGQVVIYDANNGIKADRDAIAKRFDEKKIHVIMLESICDDKEVIERNIRSVKISSPDYRSWDPDQAVKDYYGRIHDHEKFYETIDDNTWPYIRIFNVGQKIMVNRIHGYLQSRIVFFLMNIHNRFRTIYFARSGQSLIEHSYKADADLSPAGWEYAERLKDFVLERRRKTLEQRGIDPGERKLVIWTATRRRTHHTAWPFIAAAQASTGANSPTTSSPTSPFPISRSNSSGSATSTASDKRTSIDTTTTTLGSPSLRVKVIEKPQMLEINPGIWDGLSPEQAKKYYPEDWARFLKDPYSFRAPRAESYHDLSVRLDPILVELEKEQEDLLIIGHASVIRCMLAYLIGLPSSEIPAIEVARGDLLEVVPASYGVHSQAFHFWDGPGRRGSTSASVADGKGGKVAEILGRVRSGLPVGERGELRFAGLGACFGMVDGAACYNPRRGGSSLGEQGQRKKGSDSCEACKGNREAGDTEASIQDRDDTLVNFYENYAEDTHGKRPLNVNHESHEHEHELGDAPAVSPHQQDMGLSRSGSLGVNAI